METTTQTKRGPENQENIRNIYQWLWTRIGGRQWTFIMRDIWHKYEYVCIVVLVSLGVWLGHNYDWRIILVGWLIFSLGHLSGHLFWGKDYIPNQRERQDND